MVGRLGFVKGFFTEGHRGFSKENIGFKAFYPFPLTPTLSQAVFFRAYPTALSRLLETHQKLDKYI